MSTQEELTREEQAVAYYKELNDDALFFELNDFNESISEFEDATKLSSALLNLEENSDWKIFKDEYFKKEVNRITSALTSVSQFRDETEKQLHEKLTSVRHLKLFLINAEASSANAESGIADLTTFKNLIIDELDARDLKLED